MKKGVMFIFGVILLINFVMFVNAQANNTDDAELFCHKSDGGNYSVKGEVTTSWSGWNSSVPVSDQCAIKESEGSYSNVDSCNGDKCTLIEYSCDNGPQREFLPCSGGCSNAACTGIATCVLEGGQGICEFLGKTYSIEHHAGCTESVELTISYEGLSVLVGAMAYSNGENNPPILTTASGGPSYTDTVLFSSGLKEILLPDGNIIEITSAPCSVNIIHLEFKEFRKPKIITEIGTHEVYYGDKIKIGEVDVVVQGFYADMNAFNVPSRVFIKSADEKQMSLTSEDPEAVFIVGSYPNFTHAGIKAKLITFDMDLDSPTLSHARIELSKIEGKEVISPTDETGPIELNETVDENGTVIKSLCTGCSLEDKCYPLGYRKSGKYCSESGTFTEPHETGFCDNNFECSSNLCVNDECIGRSFLQRVLDWFRKLFGVE